MKKQRIRFIVNPFSGVGNKNRLALYIEKFLNQTKFEYEICHTKTAGHGKKLALEALDKNVDIIVAVGGDGSVNEISSVLIGKENSFGIIPAGSGNGFASHLGISRKTKEAIEYLNTAEPVKIDTCKVNHRTFVNVAGIGFPAMVAYKFRKSRFRGFLGYLLVSAKEYSKYFVESYSIEIDGNKYERECLGIEVTNASTYGYNMKIASDASLVDGFFNIVLIKKAPKWRYFFSMWRFINGTVHKSHLTETFKAKEVKINLKKETAVHVDGEGFLTSGPLNFSINQLSLNVLINKKDVKKK